jgi:tRNA pseudouridine55 synthase
MTAKSPRRVVIHSLDLLAFQPPRDGLARARVAVRCGKGTYVRTIASALGEAVGVPAHLGALRRTASGPFTLEKALSLDDVERLAREAPAEVAARLVAPADALAAFPSVPVTLPEIRALAQGKTLPRPVPAPFCRALDPDGALVAVVAPAEDGEGLRPVRVFVQPPEIAGTSPAKR